MSIFLMIQSILVFRNIIIKGIFKTNRRNLEFFLDKPFIEDSDFEIFNGGKPQISMMNCCSKNSDKVTLFNHFYRAKNILRNKLTDFQILESAIEELKVIFPYF